MEALAEFLDKTDLKGGWFRDQRDRILRAKNEGREAELHNALMEVRDLFEGMGGLCDTSFCKENGNIPEGMTPEYANKEFWKRIDDLFFNLLFWATDKRQAAKVYQKAIRAYQEMLGEMDREFLETHPESAEEFIPSSLDRSPLCSYHHWDPEWFREWSDLGKLPPNWQSLYTDQNSD